MPQRRRSSRRIRKPQTPTAPEPNPAVERGNGSFAAIAVAIVVAAGFLRIYEAGTQELWLDEAVSFRITVLESGLDEVLLNQNTPPLYYLLLRLWVSVAGFSEAAIRAPSVLFGTLFVGVAIWLGSMAFNRSVGLWTGLFAAVNPIHIYYSQEARAYSLLMFLVLLSYALLWRALQSDTWRGWAAFALSSALALYSHYMAILSLAPTAFLVLMWQGSTQKDALRRHYAGAVLGAALLFVPWALMRFSLHSVAGVDWIRFAWDYSRMLSIPLSLEVFGLGSERGLIFIHLKQYVGIVFPWGLRLAGLGILVLVAGAFLVPWGDRAFAVPGIAKRKAWLAMCLLFPLAVLCIASLFRPVYVVGRYDMTAFPAFPLVLGFGMAKIANIAKGGKFLAPVVALVFFSVTAAKLAAYYRTDNPLTDARHVAEFLDRNVGNGDVVVFTGLSVAPVVYYLHRRGYKWQDGICKTRSGRNFGCLTFPRETAGNVGVYQEARVLDSIAEVERDVRSFTERLDASDSQLWVVFETLESSPEYDYILPPTDLQMVTQLRAAGFQPVSSEGRVIRFAR